MSTLTTGLGCIGRIDKPHRNTRPGCFVGNVHPQLVEGPGVPFIAVFSPNVNSLTNACQVFQSECLARYNGFLDQGATDLLIRVLHEAFFTSTQFLETALGGAGSHTLQFLAAFVVSNTHFMHLGPTE